MNPLLLFVVQATALAIVPVAFALGVLRGRFTQTGEIVELGAWFSAERDPSELAGVLSNTLGDPTVEVAFWLSASARYVDVDGAEMHLPAPGAGRSFVEIELDGRRVGAIVYDPKLVADRELLRVAGRVLAIAWTGSARRSNCSPREMRCANRGLESSRRVTGPTGGSPGTCTTGSRAGWWC